MSSAMATADTDTLSAVDAVLQGDEKTTDALIPLLDVLEGMSEQSQSTASARFWMASRDEAWRIPLGESGVLSFFQSLIPTATEPTLTLNALKIIGNSCAEKDANRKRVIDHPLSLTPIITALSDAETRIIAAVVLLNICTDYEPAQLAAVEKDAVTTIFNVLTEDGFDDPLDYFLRVLELLISHDSGKAAAPEGALETLLTALEYGQEEFDNTLSLVSILSSLLTTQRFHRIVVKGDGLFSCVLDAIEKTYDLTVDVERESKDKSLIAYARNQLIEAVCEIATDSEFLEVYPLGGEVMGRIEKWLEVQPGKEELAVTACMVFGNVGRSDAVCIELVEKGLQKPLLKIVEETADRFDESVKQAREKKEAVEGGGEVAEKLPTGAMSVGVIHAAVGVLKNLAIPASNKRVLVETGAFRAVRRMLEMEGVGVGQVWYSAVSLGRLATVNTEPNAKELLASTPETQSTLSLFLKRYAEVEELPVKVEISRTIAAVLRIIYATDSEPKKELLNGLLAHPSPALEDALWDMVTQDKYPVVRSEGWFALALFAREKEGAERVRTGFAKEMQLVKDTAQGESRDRENVAVLCAGLKALGEDEGVEEILRRVVVGAVDG